MRKCTNCNTEEGVIHIRASKNDESKKDSFLCVNCARDEMFSNLKNGLPDLPLNFENIMDLLGNMMEPSQPQFEPEEEEKDFKQESKQSSRTNFGSRAMTKTRRFQKSILDEHCRDLTDLARMGEIDPIIGREEEIERTIHILNRRTKNNPVLIGEPGVGKTAIAEGLALKIAAGDVPDKLKNKSVLSLDITSVTAGTMYRGMFEERMKKIAHEIELRDDVLLFIDELHMIIGAGSSMDSNIDAANILKPYLARGKMQIIGATTLEEYRKIEEDSALSRRFQIVKVEQPSIEQSLIILNGLRSHYEAFHDIRYSNEAIEACVRLADRYISERFMPDKAIDLMDEVGSKINLLKTEKTDDPRYAKIKELDEKEKKAAANEDYPKAIEYRQLRIRIEIELENEKKDSFVVQPIHVEKIIEEMTGIPVSKMKEEERSGLTSLQQRLASKVIGQPTAVESVVKAIKRNRVGIRKTSKPITFLFTGPTGVGKTELTKRIAEEVLGDREAIIRFDMSEFMEEHSVSKLIGSPPGYVGHEDAGQLTEKVRRKPYAVILLDEIEKANKKVLNLLLQLFDEGRLTDSHGTTVDFSNTIIVMTSNLGTEAPKVISMTKTVEVNQYELAIQQFFAPELLNRIDKVVPFGQLTEDDLLFIVDLMLADIINGLKEKNITFTITENAKRFLANKGYSPLYGARPLARTITDLVEDELTDLLIEKPDTTTIAVDLGKDKEKLIIS